MYVIRRHKLSLSKKKILSLVDRALLDAFYLRCKKQALMVRSPYVSLHRAKKLAIEHNVQAVIMQINYWINPKHSALGEAEENANWLSDYFLYHCQTGIGYRNHDQNHSFFKHSKHLPNGDFLVDDNWSISDCH